MTAKAMLKKLGDELGHISLIADWIKKEAALLGEEVEEVFFGNVHSDTQGAFAQPASAGLTGAGADTANPSDSTAPVMGEPENPGSGSVEAPAEGNVPAPAPVDVTDGVGAPASDSSLANTPTPDAPTGEVGGDTAPTPDTAPSAEAPADVPMDVVTGL